MGLKENLTDAGIEAYEGVLRAIAPTQASPEQHAVARLTDSAATQHTLFSALLNFFGGGIQKRKSKKCVWGSALQVFGQNGACERSDGSAGGV